MEYKRNPNCECKNFTDIDSLPFPQRKGLKAFWSQGYIYNNRSSQECTCHRKFRLAKRYDILAENWGLPTFQELKKMEYVGEGDSYKKLKEVPSKVESKNLQDVLVYMYGGTKTQKTTSAAKLLFNVITSGHTAQYVIFSELMEKYESKSFSDEEYRGADYLVVDNCFEGQTVTIKHLYNCFYNLVLRRKKPTILISTYSLESLSKPEAQKWSAYNPEGQGKLIEKVNKYKTTILFEDNVEKIQVLENGAIDLWEM